MLSGEPGIGKSALLDHARERAAGMTVLVARGFESESELAFAALTELLRPVADGLDALPDPQRDALASAIALGPPVSGDPLTVSVAALNLIAAAAEQAPVLALIDDAHWLDRPTAEVAGFVSHHLHAEGVALLIATRAGAGGFDARGLDVVELEGLDPGAAAELARSVAPIDAAVAGRMAGLTAGNPLALIELAGSLNEQQRLGGQPLDEPVPASGWAQHVFGRRLAELPGDARRALLLATAAGGDELLPLSRALAAEDLSVAALEPAERAGLVALEPGALHLPPSAGALGRLPLGRRPRRALGARRDRGGPGRAATAPTSARGTWPRPRSSRTPRWRRRWRRRRGRRPPAAASPPPPARSRGRPRWRPTPVSAAGCCCRPPRPASVSATLRRARPPGRGRR